MPLWQAADALLTSFNAYVCNFSSLPYVFCL